MLAFLVAGDLFVVEARGRLQLLVLLELRVRSASGSSLRVGLLSFFQDLLLL